MFSAIANRFLELQGMVKASAIGLALVSAAGGFFLARRKVAPGFRARNRVEGGIELFLFLCAAIAIATTIGIVASLLYESLRFFAEIPFWDFLFGTRWNAQTSAEFGALPLFYGTFMIALIAMLIAAPVGLFAAIYLSEYAGPTVRAWVKPVLEVLAGIPTVVYGFFALLVVAPAIRAVAVWINTTLMSAGITAEPILAAQPTSALTVKHVVLPAALPGIIASLLLAVSRAIGETMIVVMAAGQRARISPDPTADLTTITVQIVSLLTGETEFDSPKTLSAFALGLVLFVITLFFNLIALRVVQKYREKYD